MFNWLKGRDVMHTWDYLIGYSALFVMMGGVYAEIKLIQFLGEPSFGWIVGTTFGGFAAYMALTYFLAKLLHRNDKRDR